MYEKIISKNLTYRKSNYWLRFLGNAFFTILFVISLFIATISFVFISTPVVGESMQPTLNSKGEYKSDIVYINKFKSYSRNDIIVLHQESSVDAEYIIKRVIGIAGDRIKIELGENDTYLLLINGEILAEPYLFDYKTANLPNNDGMESTFNNFLGLQLSKPHLFDGNELVVPQGEVFVLGDNRGRSLDSSQHGTYPTAMVVGVVQYVVEYGHSELLFLLNTFTPFNFK